jgi:hypothetical protein
VNQLKKFYDVRWEYLVDLNYEMLFFFLEKLNICTPVVRMKNYNFVGIKSSLVLDMCLQLGAEVYIFGGEGKNYADVELFKRKGVQTVFQEYNHPAYRQLHGDFISHLSIIDLLFNCGTDSLSIIMSNNLKRSELI